ncbi:MAG: VOC family protein [Chloroflexi bacterium]|nr:VOC family protein [Chloroflexota bacterium]
MIRRFNHTSVAIADPDSMLAFYRDLLGLEVIADFDTQEQTPERQRFFKNIHAMPDTHFRMIRLKGPQPPIAELALELKNWYSPTPRPFPDWQRQNDLGLHIIAFLVDDLEPVYNKVKEAGVTTISPPQWAPGVGCFKCYDPEGNVVEFIARPTTPPPPPLPLPPQPARREPPLVDCFRHTSIAIGDTNRMLAFYRDLLGLESQRDFDTEMQEPVRRQFFKNIHGMPEGHFRMTRLKGPEPPLESFALELKKWYSPSPRPLPNWQRQCDLGLHIVGFEVKDLDPIYEKLQRSGVKTVSPPQRAAGGVGCFKCYDPEGNLVEFIEPMQS